MRTKRNRINSISALGRRSTERLEVAASGKSRERERSCSSSARTTWSFRRNRRRDWRSRTFKPSLTGMRFRAWPRGTPPPPQLEAISWPQSTALAAYASANSKIINQFGRTTRRTRHRNARRDPIRHSRYPAQRWRWVGLEWLLEGSSRPRQWWRDTSQRT